MYKSHMEFTSHFRTSSSLYFNVRKRLELSLVSVRCGKKGKDLIIGADHRLLASSMAFGGLSLPRTTGQGFFRALGIVSFNDGRNQSGKALVDFRATGCVMHLDAAP